MYNLISQLAENGVDYCYNYCCYYTFIPGPSRFSLLMTAFGQTLLMVLLSALISYLIAIPLGILLVTTRKGGIFQNKAVNFILGLVVNILRSIPFFLLMFFIMPFTRLLTGAAIGVGGMIVPLVVASAPFIARIIETALLEVDKGLLEAAKSMGSSKFQIIYKLYIPESLPAVIASLGVSVVTITAFSAVAGFVNGGGLGQLAQQLGHEGNDAVILFSAIAILVVFTQLFQMGVLALYKKLDKK
ncbi:MAG: ABC transporter permease [Firmicutes bacterium]|nr:ABC transporter permease [Bacillota bacterium]